MRLLNSRGFLVLLFVYSKIPNINLIQPESDKNRHFSSEENQKNTIYACGQAREDIRRIQANYNLERRTFF
jgi:hypothetical protein